MFRAKFLPKKAPILSDYALNLYQKKALINFFGVVTFMGKAGSP